jgi:hypothetical protein
MSGTIDPLDGTMLERPDAPSKIEVHTKLNCESCRQQLIIIHYPDRKRCPCPLCGYENDLCK